VAAMPGQVVEADGRKVSQGYYLPDGCMGMHHEIWQQLRNGNHELLLDPRICKIFELNPKELVDVRTEAGWEVAQCFAAYGLT